MKRSHSCPKLRALLLVTTLLITLVLPVSAALFGGDSAAASVAAFAKNGTVQNNITFSSQDFLVETDSKLTLDSFILTSLPDLEAGVLKMGDNDLAVGDQVAMSAISGLRFCPLVSPTVATTGFSFTPVFSNGTAGEEVSVNLYLLSAPNNPPIAQNLDICTYKNVAVSSRFAATDAEGDLLTFKLVDKPARGAVTMPEDGTDAFVYTPYENKTGKDSFTYVAVDTVGNTSAPATVSVRIEKANTKVTYADMDGVPSHRAALRLAEQDIFVGECMDGQYFFSPDTPVSRGAFVAMAMSTLGLETLDGVRTTGFSDDVSIPTWAKPYVSSALKSGVVQGFADDSGQIVFDADTPVTRAEATVLLNRMLQVSDVSDTPWYADSASAPAWAWQAAVNLETIGVINTNADGALVLNASLTRGEVAEMLSATLDVLDAREEGGFPFW